MTARPLRLGTRGSALALAQARLVAGALGEPTEIVMVKTSGDRHAPGGDKSRWVDALERALLADQLDLAVHSAKDVPAALADGLALLGVPSRADPRDALCGADSLDALPVGARVGTSSMRRAAQLRAVRADLDVVELRGNVDTRLARLAARDFDAILLARAGLERLGRADVAGSLLDPATFVPAPGQGALALEGRGDDERARAAAHAIGDPDAAACLGAERALVAQLGASCRTPVGAHATLDGDRLVLVAFVGLPDGSAWIRDRVAGDRAAPAELGREAAARLRAAGADELLRQAEALA